MLKVPESHVLAILAFASLAPTLREFLSPVLFVQMSTLAPVCDLRIVIRILRGSVFDNLHVRMG
jgi:hypothetical protein